MFDNKDKIKIALPSKGRLRKDLDALFVSKNIKISNQTEDRNYLATIDGLDNLLIYFLSAKEITGRLDEGSIHLGLTCDDLVQEKIRNFDAKVDKLLQLGYIDKNNLFVTGGSAGGIMTAWIIGKTNRFKAAAVIKPVMNWISKTLVADNYFNYANYRYKGQPWENFDEYWKFSPISLVGNICLLYTSPSPRDQRGSGMAGWG